VFKFVSFFPDLLLQFFLENALNLGSLGVEISHQKVFSMELLLLFFELD